MENNDKIITSPLKAIKMKCLDCCGYQQNEVKMCPCVDCPLYNFRTGKNMARKRGMTDEQRQAAAERLKKAREAKNSQ